MKKIFKFVAVLFIFTILLSGCSHEDTTSDALYQVSTLDALMQGVYDGELSLEKLLEHGDFGIGTFDGLDGEMIVRDGIVYQVLSSGKVIKPKGAETTPFAMITFFQSQIQSDVSSISSYAQLQEVIGKIAPNQNEIYAIKVEGDFSYVKTRSVAEQTEPYPPLSEVTKDQAVFEFEAIRGTLIGYWCPEYMSGINLAGYHLHFLSEDGTMGGHLLECAIENAKISMDVVSEFQMLIPQNEHFLQLNLEQVTEEEKQDVEQ